MEKPNIVLITTDQMRADLMGCSNHPVVQTPHLDFLAKRGVYFEQAYSTTPVCIPARATIMTGLEGHTLGLTTYVEGYEIPVQETLPRQLREAGYETRVVGKMHTYPERCHYGFDSMLLCEEGRRLGQAEGKNRGYDDYENWLAEQGYPGQAFTHGIANNEYTISPWHLPDHLHPTEWIANESCKAIKRRDWTRPLFLWASFTAPHPPLTPLMRDLYMYENDDIPEPTIGDWADRHSVYHQRNLAWFGDEPRSRKQQKLAYKGFYALITQVDRAINRILGTLREEGLAKNTWIIFTSDHGDNMGDHHLWIKMSFTQGACRIPMIITPPTRGDLDQLVAPEWLPGQVSQATVGLQDLLPTCLDIAGIPIPEKLDGKSMLPLVLNPKAKIRDEILGEFGPIGKRSLMLTGGTWKYIWFEEDGEELLFHIAKDTNEKNDLSRIHSEITAIWRGKLVTQLALRQDDPAVNDEMLVATNPTKKKLNSLEKARMVSDCNPRGLH